MKKERKDKNKFNSIHSTAIMGKLFEFIENPPIIDLTPVFKVAISAEYFSNNKFSPTLQFFTIQVIKRKFH